MIQKKLNLGAAFLLTFLLSGCLTQEPVEVVDKSKTIFGRENGIYPSKDEDSDISVSSLEPIKRDGSKNENKSTLGYLSTNKNNNSSSLKPNSNDSVEEKNTSNSQDLTYVAPKENKKTAVKVTSKNYQLKTPVNSKNFVWPVVDGEVIARFGKNGNKFNEGINIVAPERTPVSSAGDGKVVYIGNNIEGYGNLVIIKHSDDFMTAYSHIDNILVERGMQVKKGEGIATVGKSGNVSVPQLHFSLRKGKKTIDPEKELR